jgi:predicted dehydrogenase
MHKIGIISGTGSGRKRTISALRDSDVCKVTVVHGRDSSRLAEIVVADPTISVTTDLREFGGMGDDYDVVYIASPPFLHAEHLEFAVSLGKPIICEKPVVTSRKDLDRVTDLLTVSSTPFMLAHHLRHQPAVEELRKIINEGEMGKVAAATLQWSFWMNHDAPSARWKLDAALGGSNALFDAGVHTIDLALLLFGRPERVAGCGHRRRSVSTVDTVAALLDYTDFTAVVTASQSASLAANDLVMTFERGAVKAPGIFAEASLGAIEVYVDGQHDSKKSYGPLNLYRAEVENFCMSLEKGAPHIGTNLSDANEAMRILFAVEDSIRAGGGFITLARAQ